MRKLLLITSIIYISTLIKDQTRLVDNKINDCIKYLTKVDISKIRKYKLQLSKLTKVKLNLDKSFKYLTKVDSLKIKSYKLQLSNVRAVKKARKVQLAKAKTSVKPKLKVKHKVKPKRRYYEKPQEEQLAHNDFDETALDFQFTEQGLDEGALKVLNTGRKMALEDKTIVRGSCWTYVDEVFRRAGFGKNRRNVYRSRRSGPYANSNMIKQGDWLYYVNHSFHNVGHSGIFVKWVDKAKQIALILSYTGRNKRKPARYRKYKIDNVFYITRAGTS